MTDYAQLAETLTQRLGLTQPPVALSFVDEAPAGVPALDEAAPAGCQFWERAAQGPFVTATKDHELCAIGVHTHNLSGASEQHPGELGRVLEVMTGLSYVTETEVQALPVLDRQTKHVVYAPLAQASLKPDAVLIFADGRQGLVITEAASRVEGGVQPALGRPACALVPQVINSGQAAVSLGCCGARAYVDALSDGVALWGLPGQNLADYVAAIDTFAQANETLGKFHELRRQDVAAGKLPTVDESLARLS